MYIDSSWRENMKSKNILLSIPILAIATMSLASCDNERYSKNGLTELEKYVVEVDEYNQLDYKYADEYFADTYDNWNGGCSAISKMIDGHRIIGRNMDLNISNKNAYIIRTNAGQYKTIGLVYTFRDISPDYDVYQKKGITDKFRKVLPFMCDDVLNDQGLHIEINMRHGEYWPNGKDKFGCEGTNKESSNRVYLFELPRYIGENCKTVVEAKEYVASLNVYSKHEYWNYCFLVSDATGSSSLLEFSSNHVNWIDEDKISEYTWLNKYDMKAIGQTNFYLNKDAYKIQDMKLGEGRFIALQEGINDVHSKLDMYNLMKKVSYSSFYLGYDECKNNHFDPRSEVIGEISWATYDYCMDEANEQTLKYALDGIGQEYAQYNRQQLQDKNSYWESTFTEVIDTNSKKIFVRMFEDEEHSYLLDFEGTRKVNSINEWSE